MTNFVALVRDFWTDIFNTFNFPDLDSNMNIISNLDISYLSVLTDFLVIATMLLCVYLFFRFIRYIFYFVGGLFS